MRAAAQRWSPGTTTARVGKPPKEEAAGAWRGLWGKCWWPVPAVVCSRRPGVGHTITAWARSGPVCRGDAGRRRVLGIRGGVGSDHVHGATRPEQSAVPGETVMWGPWVDHAAALEGGARGLGRWPLRKISMMRMVPPQSGQGSRRVSGAASENCASLLDGVSASSNARILAMFALRRALARRP